MKTFFASIALFAAASACRVSAQMWDANWIVGEDTTLRNSKRIPARLRALLLLVTWAAYCSVHGQPSLLNNIYDLGYPFNQFTNLITKNDTLIGYGMARRKEPPYQQCLFFARFDSTGFPIDTLLLCDPEGDVLSNDELGNDLVLTTDGGLAVLGSNLTRRVDVFLKFDRDFQIEFMRELEDPTSLTPYSNSIIELPDGYWIGGHAQRTNFLHDAFVRKVDKQGNTLWLKHYGDNSYTDLLKDYVRVNDSTIIGVGGYKVDGCDSAHCYGPWVLKFDLSGNVLKEWKPDTSNPVNVCWYMFPTSPSKWLATGKASIADTPNGQLYGNYAAVIDTDFNVLNVNYFEKSYVFNKFRKVIRHPDGNIIGIGQFFVGNAATGRYRGWLVKLDPQGDTLWTRVLEPSPPGAVPSESALGGVGVLSSGNMVAGGYTRANNLTYCWLLKITPDGCVDTLFCNPVPAAEPAFGDKISAQIFPNPFGSEGFSLGIAGYSPRRAALEFFDLSGKLAARFEVTSAVSEFAAPPSLPPGLYFFRLTKNGRALAAGKVVRMD